MKCNLRAYVDVKQEETNTYHLFYERKGSKKDSRNASIRSAQGVKLVVKGLTQKWLIKKRNLSSMQSAIRKGKRFLWMYMDIEEAFSKFGDRSKAGVLFFPSCYRVSCRNLWNITHVDGSHPCWRNDDWCWHPSVSIGCAKQTTDPVMKSMPSERPR